MNRITMDGFISLGKLVLFALPVIGILTISIPVVAGRCTEPIKTVTTMPIVSVNFAISHQMDGSQNMGDTKIKVMGVNGTEKQTMKSEYKCNKKLSSQIAHREELKAPVDEVILDGNRHTEVETESIPSGTQDVVDNSLSGGQRRIQKPGVNGTKQVTYTISQDEGQPIQKVKTDEKVITNPINEVVGIGPQCDPNYSGCVPNVYPSDVDCYYGTGNGPYYAHGPVRVIGIDRYGLDGNSDGWGCESG